MSQQNYNNVVFAHPHLYIRQDQARAFISMIAGNAEFDNLNIQVFYGHENHNNIIHNPQEGNFFGLGNGEHFEKIGSHRLFLS